MALSFIYRLFRHKTSNRAWGVFLLICLGLTGAPWLLGKPNSSKHPLHPSYREPVPVPKPVSMREWRYIVIHHTGSSVGNEEYIQKDHLRRGMENGMAYHFLIGNGSMGLGDGVVVMGHRWKYQLAGGHCHQDYLNENGIGICLVGNFNRRPPTLRQMQSLSRLVLSLQTQFHIPDGNVHGHGEFYGEESDCPGRYFPWKDFWSQVDLAYESFAKTSSIYPMGPPSFSPIPPDLAPSTVASAKASIPSSPRPIFRSSPVPLREMKR